MPAVGDGHPHAPVVTRVRKIPAGSLQFDVYFYPFNLLDATPAQSRMVRREDMLCRVVTPDGEKEVIVIDLLRELDAKGYTRMPFVDSDDRLIYIAHRSMLDQFVSRRALTGNVSDLGNLTMADMFAEQPEFRIMFSRTAAFVGSDATLAEARIAMEAVRNCYDVFLTDSREPTGACAGLANRRDRFRERANLNTPTHGRVSDQRASVLRRCRSVSPLRGKNRFARRPYSAVQWSRLP